MIKRGLILFAIFLLSVLTVNAEHTVTTTITPLEAYEGDTIHITLIVENDATSLDNINEVALTIPNGVEALYDVQTVGDPVLEGGSDDWNYTTVLDGEGRILTITWSTATGAISSAGTQEFQVKALVLDVDESENNSFEIDTRDENNDTDTTSNESTVINDDAPIIELVSPVDDSLDSNSVDLEFNIIDKDIDDNLTVICGLYIDDIRNRTLSGTGNNVITVELDEGEHSWYVNCTDSRGQDSQSEEGSFFVDLTAPVIESLTSGEQYRVDDIVILADVEDALSGVDSVTANVTWNGLGVCMNVVLSLNNDLLYEGVCETNENSFTGEYVIDILAVDKAGNSAVNISSVELKASYVLNFELSSESVLVGEEVVLSGTVTEDNGDSIAEDMIILYLPDGEVNVSIDDDKFNYTFSVSDAGEYTIKAAVNGFEAETVLYVNEEGSSAPVSSSSSGGSSGSDYYCGDGRCTQASSVGENCRSCPEDCGECKKREKDDTTSGGFELVDEEEPRVPAGVGSASGWFRTIVTNTLAVLLFIGLLAGLYVMSTKKDKKKSKVNWNGYFNR